jgi:hypothetical protein
MLLAVTITFDAGAGISLLGISRGRAPEERMKRTVWSINPFYSVVGFNESW